MRRILILGATSAIASETAKRFAEEGDRFFLVGRDSARLEIVSADLKTRGADGVFSESCNLDENAAHEGLFERARGALGEIDLLLVAYGTLPHQRQCEEKVDEALKALHTNFISVVSVLTIAARYFETRRNGQIAVISSVAGLRGRQSNYVYGAAKGALSIFLAGLRNRLMPAGVQVLTVLPGFVDTPMTAGFKKGPLFVGPEVIARDIHRAVVKRRDVLYTPWFWRWIMFIIIHIPEVIFKRLKL